MAEKEGNPSLSRIPLNWRIYAISPTFIMFDIISEIGEFVKLSFKMFIKYNNTINYSETQQSIIATAVDNHFAVTL